MGEHRVCQSGQKDAIRAVVALAVMLTLFASSCSSGAASDAASDQGQVADGEVAFPEDNEPASAAVESAIETTSTTLGLIGSENAQFLKSLAGELTTDSPEASAFVESAAGERLDILGDQLCTQLPPEPSISKIQSTSLASYDSDLSDEERESLSSDSWPIVVGAVLQSYCPERIPIFDGAVQQPLDMYTFRASIPTITTMPDETLEFVNASSDIRLGELKFTACSAVDPSMDTAALTAAILSSYEELTDAEQAQLTPRGYGELYTALVGFFCIENVPQ